MKHIFPAFRMLLFMTFLTGLAYPLAMTAVSQLLFKDKANGSLLERGGHAVGSEFVAQKFESAKYFWSRPSGGDYNPLPSGGTNLGQTSEALKKQVDERTAKLQAAHGAETPIPQDLLFASSSGLDPHISPEAALYQVSRVATARGLSLEQVKSLVNQHVEGRQIGFLGEPRVNVLQLNLALDRLGN
jgi:potassium-transporting ATPase KdpC subunit